MQAIKTIAKVIHPAVHFVAYPVIGAANVLHRVAPKFGSKPVKKCTLGSLIMVAGTFTLHHGPEAIPHFIWEAIASALHAYGAAPFIKVLCMKLDLEDVESEVEHAKERDAQEVRVYEVS